MMINVQEFSILIEQLQFNPINGKSLDSEVSYMFFHQVEKLDIEVRNILTIQSIKSVFLSFDIEICRKPEVKQAFLDLVWLCREDTDQL